MIHPMYANQVATDRTQQLLAAPRTRRAGRAIKSRRGARAARQVATCAA